MHIQFNTDNHIDGNEALESRVNAMVEQHLGRFFPRLTQLQVYLSDSNAAKSGANDKRCSLEAHMEKENPIAATHDDEDLAKAINGACSKLKSKLDTIIGKRRNH